MRDPLFFRWHAWIDDFFQMHKESDAVRRYSRSEVIRYSYLGTIIFCLENLINSLFIHYARTAWFQHAVSFKRSGALKLRG